MVMARYSNILKLLILTLCLFLTFTDAKRFPGTIKPLDPYLVVGSNVSITCKLNRTLTPSNASQIKWQKDDKSIGSDITVHVISTTEAQIRFYNVTFQDKEMMITCFLQKDAKAATILEVGIVPPPPTLQCRSTNITAFWCEWSKDYTGVRTKYTFQFKKYGDAEWGNCTNVHSINKHKDKCIIANYTKGQTYLVRVTATNVFGSNIKDSKFNPVDEAIPLPPVIEKVLAGRYSIQVFWKLQENFKYAPSMRYQLRYRFQKTKWTTLPETRHKNQTIEVSEIGSKYEFEVRSKFLRKNFSEWGPTSVVSVPEPVTITVNTTSPRTTPDQFMLQWRKPAENEPRVAYYEISGNCGHQSFNTTSVDKNYIIIDVPCDDEDDDSTVGYNFQVTAINFSEGVIVTGQPSMLSYEFDCQKAVPTTKKESLTRTPSNTIKKEDFITGNPSNSPQNLLVPFLLVGILFLIGVLFWLCFQKYFQKQLFTKWPEPKFFRVEINATFQPRPVEKEVFDKLKTKSDCLPSHHSSTSSDQGFHELSPHLPIGKGESTTTYVKAPSSDSNETDYQVSPVKESTTEYLQLQQTGYRDILQLSPLQTDQKSIENNSDPYTFMPPISSGQYKPPGSHTPLSYGSTDPYCKLHEVEPISCENDRLTQYIPVFNNESNETDYSAGDEDVINIEDEIQNLLNGVPKLTMNYVCQGDRQIL